MDTPTYLRLLTNAEMAEVDSRAIAGGIAGEALMEQAGSAVAREIITRFKPCSTVVLCGPGNNGGDGFVIARKLRDEGWDIVVALLGERQNLKGDAAIMAGRYEGEVSSLSVDVLEGKLLVVDALFGSGLARPIEDVAGDVLDTAKDSAIDVVAVDIPSGVDGDTGQVLGTAMPATLTVTFSVKKPGHLLMPGKDLCGEVVLAEIGHPEAMLEGTGGKCFENDPALWINNFPWPEADKHKYSRGHAVVVGGDEQMTGAARLSAMAALRTSAGLVTVACPVSAHEIYAKTLTAVMTKAVEDVDALGVFIDDDKKHAVLIGPGAGVGKHTRDMVLEILKKRKPCVLDADALSSFEGDAEQLFAAIRDANVPVIMTPHPGEFTRVFGEIGADKLTVTRNVAAKSGAVVVLKGSDSVIAGPNGMAVINSNAPATLATAGSGDVLAGIAVGLLASNMDAFEAACAAVWLHGECANRFGLGLTAEDLVETLPDCLMALDKCNKSMKSG